MSDTPVNQSTTQSTSGMASGLTGSAGVVFVWLLSLRGITVPPDVALAVAALVAPVVHYAFVRLTMASTPSPTVVEK
jgi:hypothetical protein